MTPADVRRGYPRLDEWQAVRDRVDPAGVWASDLSRRLGAHRHCPPTRRTSMQNALARTADHRAARRHERDRASDRRRAAVAGGPHAGPGVPAPRRGRPGCASRATDSTSWSSRSMPQRPRPTMRSLADSPPSTATSTSSSWPSACSATRPTSTTTRTPPPRRSTSTTPAACRASLAFAGVMRRQGHGHLAVLSSVAGERGRAVELRLRLVEGRPRRLRAGSGRLTRRSAVCRSRSIRPGFVHSRMTRGMKSAPFATTPRVVGELAVAGMRKGRHTVWTPGILRYVFSILRHVPRPIFRRLPLG